jgi:probable rRNA maturation factor
MERETADNPPPEPGRPRPGRPDALHVEVADAQSRLAVDPGALAGLARRALRAEGVRAASISIALVDDATIHDLNRRHLGHDWPTDVITFALSDPGEPELSGELVVSAEMAATTAEEAGLDPSAELALYVIHGLLHLCGLDDLTPDDADAMRRREAWHLDREGIPNTFARVGAAADDSRRGGAR